MKFALSSAGTLKHIGRQHRKRVYGSPAGLIGRPKGEVIEQGTGRNGADSGIDISSQCSRCETAFKAHRHHIVVFMREKVEAGKQMGLDPSTSY